MLRWQGAQCSKWKWRLLEALGTSTLCQLVRQPWWHAKWPHDRWTLAPSHTQVTVMGRAELGGGPALDTPNDPTFLLGWLPAEGLSRPQNLGRSGLGRGVCRCVV